MAESDAGSVVGRLQELERESRRSFYRRGSRDFAAGEALSLLLDAVEAAKESYECGFATQRLGKALDRLYASEHDAPQATEGTAV